MFFGVGDESLGSFSTTSMIPQRAKLPQPSPWHDLYIAFKGGIGIQYDGSNARSNEFWDWVESVIGYDLDVGSGRRSAQHASTGWGAILSPKNSSSNAMLMIINLRVYPLQGYTVMDYKFGGQTLADLAVSVPSGISNTLVGKALFLSSGDLPTLPTKDKGRFQGGPGLIPSPGRTDSDDLTQPSLYTPSNIVRQQVVADNWARFPCVVDSFNMSGEITTETGDCVIPATYTISVRVPSGVYRNPFYSGMEVSIPTILDTFGRDLQFKVDNVSKSRARPGSPFSPGQEFQLSLTSEVAPLTDGGPNRGGGV